MTQERKAAEKTEKMVRKIRKNLGSLNCLTLLVPSGTRNMLIFLEANSYPQLNKNAKRNLQINLPGFISKLALKCQATFPLPSLFSVFMALKNEKILLATERLIPDTSDRSSKLASAIASMSLKCLIKYFFLAAPMPGI